MICRISTRIIENKARICFLKAIRTLIQAVFICLNFKECKDILEKDSIYCLRGGNRRTKLCLKADPAIHLKCVYILVLVKRTDLSFLQVIITNSIICLEYALNRSHWLRFSTNFPLIDLSRGRANKICIIGKTIHYDVKV